MKIYARFAAMLVPSCVETVGKCYETRLRRFHFFLVTAWSQNSEMYSPCWWSLFDFAQRGAPQESNAISNQIESRAAGNSMKRQSDNEQKRQWKENLNNNTTCTLFWSNIWGCWDKLGCFNSFFVIVLGGLLHPCSLQFGVIVGPSLNLKTRCNNCWFSAPLGSRSRLNPAAESLAAHN